MVRANFDTGSANPWIFSQAAMDRDISGLYHAMSHPFNEHYSRTFRDHIFPEEVRVMFGSGPLIGRFVSDTIRVGDSGNQIVLNNFIFGLATQSPKNGGMFDALIGLGYPQFAHEGITPLFDALILKGVLKEKIFSWYMSQHLEETDEKSELIFGGYNRNRFTGNIGWHKVVDQRFFTVELQDVLLNGRSLGYCNHAKPRCRAAPDSGSTSMGVPAAFKKVMDSKFPVKNCSTKQWEKSGVLTFVIDKIHYDLQYNHFIRRIGMNTQNPE